MKNAVYMQIDYDGRDQRSYQGVTYIVYDNASRPILTKQFASNDPSEDWNQALHEALSFEIPIWRSASCDNFVNSGPYYSWGTDPGKSIILNQPKDFQE